PLLDATAGVFREQLRERLIETLPGQLGGNRQGMADGCGHREIRPNGRRSLGELCRDGANEQSICGGRWGSAILFTPRRWPHKPDNSGLARILACASSF